MTLKCISSNRLIFLALLLKTIFINAQDCDPVVACSDSIAGDNVIDSTDCHNYYTCITDGSGNVVPSTLPLTCKPGFYFEFDNGTCLEETSPCVNLCVNMECRHVCIGMTTHLIAFPYNCSKYYLCVAEGDPPLEQTCTGSNKYFNGITCSNDPYLCCDICTPYCKKAFTEVYDPFDCHSYYLCTKDDYIPTDEAHFTCPAGQQFDETVPTCVAITTPECQPVCTTTDLR